MHSSVSKMNWKFQEIKPAPYLENVIKNFWIFEYESNELRSDFFLPSGMAYLFFMKTDEDFESTFIDSNEVSFIKDGLYGGYINSKTTFAHRKISVVGMSLYPIYLELICKDGPERLMNTFAEIDECEVFSVKELSKMPLDQIIDLLGGFTWQHIQENPVNEEVVAIYKKVKEVKEYKTSIEELSDYTKYSARQLNNLFKKHLGVSPKRFIQIVRLNHGLDLIDKNNPLSNVAYELGYHDQSHFIRDFKKMTGMTPKQMTSNENTISRKFRLF